MKKAIERFKIAMRNHARRQLVREYGRNVRRNKEICAELGLLNTHAELEAVAERLADEWPSSAEVREAA